MFYSISQSSPKEFLNYRAWFKTHSEHKEEVLLTQHAMYKPSWLNRP